MGLLDKWTKKKEKDQLKAVEKKTGSVEVNATVEEAPKKKVAKKATDKTTAPKGSLKSSIAYRVLVAPIVSEKAAGMEVHGKYSFIVKNNATKLDIKKAIISLYGVTPKSVRTAHFEGKRVRFGVTRGKRSDWKKATITLPEGKSINIHEGV